MIAGLRLAPLFLRRGNRGDDLSALGLTAAGVAVATALTLVALSLRPALDARDDRMAWREPAAAPLGQAIAVQRRSTDVFEHQLIDRVDLAPLATTPKTLLGTHRIGHATATGEITPATLTPTSPTERSTSAGPTRTDKASHPAAGVPGLPSGAATWRARGVRVAGAGPASRSDRDGAGRGLAGAAGVGAVSG